MNAKLLALLGDLAGDADLASSCPQYRQAAVELLAVEREHNPLFQVIEAHDLLSPDWFARIGSPSRCAN